MPEEGDARIAEAESARSVATERVPIARLQWISRGGDSRGSDPGAPPRTAEGSREPADRVEDELEIRERERPEDESAPRGANADAPAPDPNLVGGEGAGSQGAPPESSPPPSGEGQGLTAPRIDPALYAGLVDYAVYLRDRGAGAEFRMGLDRKRFGSAHLRIRSLGGGRIELAVDGKGEIGPEDLRDLRRRFSERGLVLVTAPIT
ncbi:MAG: hypothetical protein R3F20_13600 [Planctomycetota bacterium]